MAQLKDTLIQGSARVTDTLYANNLSATNANITSLTSTLITPSSATYSTTIEKGIEYYNDTTLLGHIGVTTSSGVVAVCASGTVALRAGATINTTNNTFDSNTGVNLTTTELAPKTTGTLSLGTSSLKWTNIYSTIAEITTVKSDHLILKVTGAVSDAASNFNQLEYIANDDNISYAKVVTNKGGTLGLFSKRLIALYPGGLGAEAQSTASTNSYQSTDGVYIEKITIYPVKNSAMSLGKTDRKWVNIYTTNIYSTDINSTTLSPSYNSSSAKSQAAGINFMNNSTVVGHIGCSSSTGGIGIYHNNAIWIRPDIDPNNSIACGVAIKAKELSPGIDADDSTNSTNYAMSLGSSTNQWTDTYTKALTIDQHVTLSYNSSDLSLNFNFS